MSEETLRALIRYLPPIMTLRGDMEQSSQLEACAGMGDAAVKVYTGLHASVARFVDDPYLDALRLEVPEDAGDKEKVRLVALAAGQLLALVQGQLGLVLPRGGGMKGNLAPNIIIQNVGEAARKDVLEIAQRALGSAETEDETDAE